ncbi:MAG: hypothetical protein RJB13_1671 [Pseudomonadota bacterium]
MSKLFVLPFLSSLTLAALTLAACNKSQTSAITSAQMPVDNSKKITFIIGPVSRSVSVKQIEEFVSNESANNDVTALLKSGKLNASEIRTQLKNTFQFDLVQMDKILNSPLGVALLTKLGDAVHPHATKTAAVQAVRSAIILALADDNKLSGYEVLSHIPVNMDIEILELLKLKKELGDAFGSATL